MTQVPGPTREITVGQLAARSVNLVLAARSEQRLRARCRAARLRVPLANQNPIPALGGRVGVGEADNAGARNCNPRLGHTNVRLDWGRSNVADNPLSASGWRGVVAFTGSLLTLALLVSLRLSTLQPLSPATAPQASVRPSMTQASSCTVPTALGMPP